jgi:glycine betaine/proline transport system ATP-binding protein
MQQGNRATFGGKLITPLIEVKPEASVGISDSYTPVISVRSLWKVFGKNPERALAPEYASKDKATVLNELGIVVGLQDVNFDVAWGETFVFMGLSGSGKSTLVRCLIRLIEPTAGEIMVEGQAILNYDEKRLISFRRDKVAMVFQHFGLLPHRRVIDNVAWGLEVQGADKTSRYIKAQEVLELVGLKGWEQAYPRELSGGMQQRVGLARALAVDPDILLMDEPFSGLDPLIRREMQEELVRLQLELHKTIVFITHDLDEALKIGDRIAIMRDGRIIQIGSPEDIVLTPEDEYVSEFTRGVRRESIMTASSVMTEPGAVILDYQGPRVALRTMRSNASPVALVVGVQGNFLGMLTLEQARRAAQAGVKRLAEHLEYLNTSVSPVTPDTPLDQLIPLTLTTDQPIPVVDQHGKLVGEIHRTAVAGVVAISNNPSEKVVSLFLNTP